MQDYEQKKKLEALANPMARWDLYMENRMQNNDYDEEDIQVENTQPTQKDYTHSAVAVSKTDFDNQVSRTEQTQPDDRIKNSDQTLVNSLNTFGDFQQLMLKIQQELKFS